MNELRVEKDISGLGPLGLQTNYSDMKGSALLSQVPRPQRTFAGVVMLCVGMAEVFWMSVMTSP